MRRFNRLIAAGLIGWGAALGACSNSSNNQVDLAALEQYILAAPPEDIGVKLDVHFDNKIVLLGAKLEGPAVAAPGSRLKLRLYWKVNEALGEDGWRLFTHVLDGSGERIMNADNVGPLRQLVGNRQALWPSAWQAGKVYVDEQELVIPAGLKTSKLEIAAGIWKDNKRLPIISGNKDGQNRAIIATLNTGVQPGSAKAASAIPELQVWKLNEGTQIQIDGKLDEPAWQQAAHSGPFVDVSQGGPNKRFPVDGSVKLLWDSEHLYVGFEVKDKDVVGGFDPKQVDPQLWNKDTVEIMIDPDGDGDNRDYYEIQINPQNLVFDSQFDSYNMPRVAPHGPFGHQSWSAELKSAVTIQGTLDDSSDRDEGYIVEAAIPWRVFTKAKQSPPRPGDSWRMNFYAMQNNGGVAWSPILGQGNFHKASRFGRVLWKEHHSALKEGAAPSAPPQSATE